MGGAGVRRAGRFGTVLLLAIGGLGVAAPPSGATECAAPSRLFAVDADTGRLSELESCPDPAAITMVGEVSAADWRGVRQLVATGDGTITVVYAVTADGRLEASRQSAPGAPLEASVPVGAGIDWSQFASFVASTPGHLVGVAVGGGPARRFRHEGWADGGTSVTEGVPLIAAYGLYGEPSLTAAGHGSYAEGFVMSTHWRIWSQDGRWSGSYASGRVPTDVSRLTGTEPRLYGIRGGAVVRLLQPPHPAPPGRKFYSCPFNDMPWQVAAELPGRWLRVVAPVHGDPAGPGPSVGPFPRRPDQTCPDGAVPYEWQ